jgi:hypothetical protein
LNQQGTLRGEDAGQLGDLAVGQAEVIDRPPAESVSAAGTGFHAQICAIREE